MMAITLHIAFLIFLCVIVWYIHNHSTLFFEKKRDYRKNRCISNRNLLSQMVKGKEETVKSIQENYESLDYQDDLAEWFKSKSDNIYNNVLDENTSKISDLPKHD